MSCRAITIGLAALVWAVPAIAQERGTVEFGAFGSAATFNTGLTLNSGYGGGGRIGVYLDPRWSIEAEDGEMRATRTLGLHPVNVGILSTRLTNAAIKSGAFSLLLGAGFGAGTETNFMHTYGVNALVGAKIALSNSAAIRIDGIADWLANDNWKSYESVHVGLSLYRMPFERTVVRTVTVEKDAAPMTPMPSLTAPRSDSVSADEQARLRRRDAEYMALRDSLAVARSGTVLPSGSSAAALATMEAQIHFATDKSDLSPEAQALLDSKVEVFRANPALRIVIVGNTDERASDAYNMSLGGRRAAAAKGYLVSKGVDGGRIEIVSDGKRDPQAAGTSLAADATNRRDAFRLVIGPDYVKPPTP